MYSLLPMETLQRWIWTRQLYSHLSHLNISNATIKEHTISFTLQLLCVDIVDYNKDGSPDDEFYGNDNMQDILNTQLQVVNDIVSHVKKRFFIY